MGRIYSFGNLNRDTFNGLPGMLADSLPDTYGRALFDQWRLSPAYDMGFAYNPEGAWTKTHQMSVNGKFDGLTRKDLLECAVVNNIKNAPEIIDQICEVASGWPTLAKECGVPQTMIDAIVPHLLLKL